MTTLRNKAVHTPLPAGAAAPNFTLSDQKGERHSLSEYRSEWVLLYFLSREELEACTPEDCPSRHHFEKFKQRRVNAMAIVPASVEENLAFAKAHDLSFRILADPEKKVSKLYGVIVRRVGSSGRERDSVSRTSFLISPQGQIERVYRDADPQAHGGEVLADLMKIPETADRRFSIQNMKIPGQDRRFSL